MINVPYPQKKRRERKKTMQHDIAKKTMESKIAHITDLSDYLQVTKSTSCQGSSIIFLHPSHMGVT